MKCMECQYFKILQKPIRAKGGGYWDLGLAKCCKHNLVVDFASPIKLERLECVEGKNMTNVVKKDFIVRRSITMLEGEPHVETYSEEELIRCKYCKYGEKANAVYLCGKSRGFGIAHEPNWFCADAERKEVRLEEAVMWANKSVSRMDE